MRTSELADESADGFARRRRNEVELTGLGRPGENAGFAVSINCRFSTVHRGLQSIRRLCESSGGEVYLTGTVPPAGGTQTKAVKVLIEHRRGLTVALYLPWQRKMWGGHIFGEVMAMPAKPEVHPWSGDVRT